MAKVIVGMSGGVDSSVAGYLLKEKGYEVEGISFLMWEENKGPGSAACCSLQAMDDASKAARSIGISHSTIDVRNDFMDKVVKPFVRAYISGLTPNPCILCNRFIKFPFLIKEAQKKGAGFISTGHYARVEKSQKSEVRSQKSVNEIFLLKKGGDSKKDQSYVLYPLTQEVLGKLILPLGYCRKSDVRNLAKEFVLPASGRPESQEICFVEEKNYLAFIEQLSPARAEPGPIADLNGRVIGSHKGIYGYTIGQRKGLGISSPEPLYVIHIDILKNTVYVGPREAAKKKEFFVEELNWIIAPNVPEFRASVKVRSTMKEEPATITLLKNPLSSECGKEELGGLLDGIVRVVFDEPQWAPAPGQSAVFYDCDMVIGGGVIRRSA
jgi:tRNA-specific 2-thiouridylase